MARPRVFISSTFYDLRHIRADLERFVANIGYDPVLSERGHIPYINNILLEDSCYKEIESCDIVIGIIGGRYGSQSQHSDQSITQTEIERALELRKQVYIFIENNVNIQYKVYKENIENKEIDATKIKYSGVDSIKVFEYIDKINAPSRINVIHHFDNVEEIYKFLEEQWAGLLKEFLQSQSKQTEIKILDEINRTAQTLQQLVNYFTSQQQDNTEIVKNILLVNHPAIEQVRNILDIQARIYFSNIDEMLEWFSTINIFCFKKDSEIDIFYFKEALEAVTIQLDVFDKNGNLIPCTASSWDSNNIKIMKGEDANLCLYKNVSEKNYHMAMEKIKELIDVTAIEKNKKINEKNAIIVRRRKN